MSGRSTTPRWLWWLNVGTAGTFALIGLPPAGGMVRARLAQRRDALDQEEGCHEAHT